MKRREVVLRVECRSTFLPALSPRRAVLSYRAEDPLAVTVCVGMPVGRPRVHTFARDLLEDGLLVECGDGEVHLRPDPGHAVVELVLGSLRSCAPVRVMVHEGDLCRFLTSTYELVPRCAEIEQLGLDRWLDRLLT
jgi:hypothetical protein